jgi:hypothetical protein
VTGDAPQPGETPRKESNPWSFSDPDTAFWSGDADREPAGAIAAEPARHRGPSAQAGTLAPPTINDTEKQYTGAAAEALAAGRRDAGTELAEPGTTEQTKTEQTKIEREHLRLDAARFNPVSAYAETTPESAALDRMPVPPRLPVPESARTATPEPARKAIPMPAGPSSAPKPVPPQPPTGLSRLSQAAPRPPSPLLETSTFWLTDEQRAERATTLPAEEIREKLIGPGGVVKHRVRSPRRPATGLLALISLGLVAAFFAWVSAEPFWLAVGHGDSGVATVAQCSGNGVTQRCAGQFQATGGRYARTKVTLLGVAPGQRNPGAISPARMVSSTSHQAYVGETGLLVQLRWLLGFGLVLLCGLAIAALTGARRLETARARRSALVMSLTGPIVLLAGFLYITY